MREKAVEMLFSLFTTSDRAVAMAGDLAEERPRRGWTWFWLHTASITLTLWRDSVTRQPARVLALMLAALGLLAAPACVGVAAVFLVPHSMNSPLGWIALSLCWWGGALCTGATLAILDPRRAMTACALMAISGVALWLTSGVPAVWRDPSNSGTRPFFAIGLLSAIPLLLGAAVARRKPFTCSALPQEQPQ